MTREDLDVSFVVVNPAPVDGVGGVAQAVGADVAQLLRLVQTGVGLHLDAGGGDRVQRPLLRKINLPDDTVHVTRNRPACMPCKLFSVES